MDENTVGVLIKRLDEMDPAEIAEYESWLSDFSASMGDFDKYDLF